MPLTVRRLRPTTGRRRRPDPGTSSSWPTILTGRSSWCGCSPAAGYEVSGRARTTGNAGRARLDAGCIASCCNLSVAGSGGNLKVLDAIRTNPDDRVSARVCRAVLVGRHEPPLRLGVRGRRAPPAPSMSTSFSLRSKR